MRHSEDERGRHELSADCKRDAVFDIAADSDSAEKAFLSTFALIMEEIRKTPEESLPELFELVAKFNAEHGTDMQ